MFGIKRAIEDGNRAFQDALRVIQRVVEAQGSELVTLRTANVLLKERIASLETTLDWMRSRVNQAEAERGIMMEKMTGLPMPTPQIQTRDVRDSGLFDDLSFEDVGDDKARVMGLEHDEDGRVK